MEVQNIVAKIQSLFDQRMQEYEHTTADILKCVNFAVDGIKKYFLTIHLRVHIEDITIIAPPFESSTRDMILKACEYTNTPTEFKLHEPIEKINIEEITVGFIYFFRMVHIAENRLAARGIGSYAKRTMQPGGGRKHRGGQRMGEMEVACLIAHDGMENLYESITTKSDCIDLKKRHIKKVIASDFFRYKDDETIVPESVMLLNDYLTVLGVSK